jgi:outer membrane lipoprotein-sorting protein
VPVALAVLLSGHAHTAGAAPAAGTAGAAGASRPTGASPEAAKPQKLTAGEIIERNVAARGGLAAWHGVRTLATSGHMDIGGRDSIEVPFRLEMKRPRKLRFQLEFQAKRAVQIYDGAHGWKARQYLGRDDTEPYSPQEQQQAADEQELDGPLVDYKSKGTTVALEGTEEVEGHAAYKLKLTLKNGSVRRDWIDARSFLELKLEGQPRRLDGRMHDVEVYYRDYRPVAGLMIPYVLETAVQGVRPGVKATHKMTIEKVEVNPKIDDSVFTRPQALTAASAGSR